MRIIVGVSGASGVILAKKMLLALKQYEDMEIHLVMSDGAKKTFELETSEKPEDLGALANFTHPIGDLAASISSGSFKTAGMIVIPCSMKTLAGIVHGYSDNLLLRAADVCLKENRKLVLVARELPFSRLHLENMLKATQLGATVMPPLLTYYNNPQTIDDMVNHLMGKILMQFDLDYTKFKPWQGA
jgi:4-hydroxy-3-polyprenylbenzoate decarboxylase